MQNFPGIVFIWQQTYREIFKSALVYFNGIMTEAVARKCSVKKAFLNVSEKKKKTSQKNTCIGVPFLIKLQTSALSRSAFNKYLRTTNSLASHFIVTHYTIIFTIYLFLNFPTLCSDIVAIRPSLCYRYVLDRMHHSPRHQT